MPIDPEVKKQLDAVVGERYAPPRNWRATILKWLGAAMLAVVASVVIVSILNIHAIDAKTSAAAKRPVQVQLLPPSSQPAAPQKAPSK